jgi:hypothetical protein
MPSESYWDKLRQESARSESGPATDDTPFTASMVATDRRAMDDDRELPARATLTNQKGKQFDVGLDDDVPGMPGYVVGEISAERGVNLLAAQGSGGKDHWVKPVPAQHKVTDASKKQRARSEQVADSSYQAEYDRRFRKIMEMNRQAKAIGIHENDYWSEQDRIRRREDVAGDARGYSAEYIYGHVPDEDVDEAAMIDFDSTSEVTYWDDYENTGMRLYERETDDGEKRYFLQEQDGSVINITGIPTATATRQVFDEEDQ